MKRLALVLPVLLAVAPQAAFAHTGQGDAAGLMHGFAHPLGGADHVLAMVAVGLVAALRGGRALWLVPLSFLAMMAAGSGLGMTGVGLPHVEAGIGLSIVAFGLLAAFRLALPLAATMALVGAFAMFHGYAHGAEMPETGSGLAYGLGFLCATALLHLVGIGLGLAIGRAGGARVAPVAGGLIAAAGVGVLAGAF